MSIYTFDNKGIQICILRQINMDIILLSHYLTLYYQHTQFEYKSNMHKSNKQAKIRKSSSMAHLKTMPLEKIQFNPKEFEVGESNIQRLPLRIISRRNSQPSLPRTQKLNSKSKQMKQSKQLEISLLVKINEKLSKQNKELKKQIDLYKKITQVSSKSTSSKNYAMDQDLSSTRKQLRNTIVEKINRTKCSSRLISDSETGLYSSKQVSYTTATTQLDYINQMYQNYIKRQIKPTFSIFYQQLRKYFRTIEETYIKLNYLFQTFNHKNIITKVKHSSQYNYCQGLIRSINEICQARIQQQKATKYPGLNTKSKSKAKVQRQLSREKQEPLQAISPEQVIDRFEKYILKVLKSPKILKGLKSNLVVRKFTKKLSEV